MERATCEQLKAEGFSVVQDHVVHSQGQYTVFGRHDVPGDPQWECCLSPKQTLTVSAGFALRRVRRRPKGSGGNAKHGNSAVSQEVGGDDNRFDLHVQSLVWWMQTCGCPVFDVMRLCRAFCSLPLEQKRVVW